LVKSSIFSCWVFQMKIVPLNAKTEPLFWKHVYTDIPDYFYFILDMKHDRDKTEITLALDKENNIDGVMMVYRNNFVQLRGSKEAATALVSGLSVEKAEITVPAEHPMLVLPSQYEVKKTLKLMVMALRKGEENPQIKHELVRLSTADAEDIAAIMRAGDVDFWSEITAQQIVERMNERLWLGVKVDGKLVSIGGTRLEDWASNIHTVATHEDYRNRGYATSVVSALVEEILERSDLALIHVRSENVPAIRIYTKVGFKPYKEYIVARAEKIRKGG
jgi:predicted GNAT family acetyltransferase